MSNTAGGAIRDFTAEQAGPAPAAADSAVPSRVSTRVWDLPLRLFHWLLVASILAAYLTANLGGDYSQWHGRCGALIIGLLVFRVVWGFIGPSNARFASFFPTPSRIQAYVRGRWQGIGHNPLGGLSVLALLGIVAAQAASGLFANDDIAFEGPWAVLVDKSLSDALSGWHHRIFNLLLGLIVLHLGAIAFYWIVRKNNLLLPMLSGNKRLKPATTITASKPYSPLRLAAALLLASLSVWAIFGAAPKAPPPQSAPAAAPGPSW